MYKYIYINTHTPRLAMIDVLIDVLMDVDDNYDDDDGNDNDTVAHFSRICNITVDRIETRLDKHADADDTKSLRRSLMNNRRF